MGTVPNGKCLHNSSTTDKPSKIKFTNSATAATTGGSTNEVNDPVTDKPAKVTNENVDAIDAETANPNAVVNDNDEASCDTDLFQSSDQISVAAADVSQEDAAKHAVVPENIVINAAAPTKHSFSSDGRNSKSKITNFFSTSKSGNVSHNNHSAINNSTATVATNTQAPVQEDNHNNVEDNNHNKSDDHNVVDITKCIFDPSNPTDQQGRKVPTHVDSKIRRLMIGR